MTDDVRPADHEARVRAAANLADDTISAGPMWDAVIALDTLAILAGIQAPASTAVLPSEALSISLLEASRVSREALAAAMLRRSAAWATALVAALPDTQEN
jgi:hypothetical protein